jgi:transposase
VFIKATKTHADKAGQVRKSHRLVRNVRVDGRVRQQTLLNLGTRWDVPRELWLRIAGRTEEILAGRQALFPEPETVEQHAQHLARQLRAKGFGLCDQPDPAIAKVDLDSMEHQHPVSVGAERICLKALEDLGFRRILVGCGLSPRDARIAAAIVAARMIHPSSEREASRWLQGDSALPELLGLDTDQRALSRKTLYRVCDQLWKHRRELQQGLRQQEAALFEIPDAIVLYDLTNTHCCGLADGTLRRRGRSKQRRHDCPLVTTALMLDSAGFPRACEILPGNVSECGTLADAITRLREECGPEQPRPSVVMDAGIATEANLAWLREQGYDWICVNRGRRPAPPEAAPDLELITASRTALQVWSLGVEDGERRLYLRSEAKKQKEDAILTAKRTRFEAELRSLHEGLTVPGRTKKYERVLERVGRLRERYARVSSQYEIHVDRDPGKGSKGPGANATAVRCVSRPSLEQADASAGAYLLRTSHLDWNLQHIVERYLQITEVESVFRALKGELGLRPIWHQHDNQIRAHLFIAVLAYHAVHLIRTRLKVAGNNLCWASIRNRLRNWVRITTTIQEVAAGQITCRQDVLPSAETAEIARQVGVKPGNYRCRSRRQN